MLSECGEAAALAPWALSPVPAASAQLLGTEPGEEAGGGGWIKSYYPWMAAGESLLDHVALW